MQGQGQGYRHTASGARTGYQHHLIPSSGSLPQQTSTPTAVLSEQRAFPHKQLNKPAPYPPVTPSDSNLGEVSGFQAYDSQCELQYPPHPPDLPHGPLNVPVPPYQFQGPPHPSAQLNQPPPFHHGPSEKFWGPPSQFHEPPYLQSDTAPFSCRSSLHSQVQQFGSAIPQKEHFPVAPQVPTPDHMPYKRKSYPPVSGQQLHSLSLINTQQPTLFHTDCSLLQSDSTDNVEHQSYVAPDSENVKQHYSFESVPSVSYVGPGHCKAGYSDQGNSFASTVRPIEKESKDIEVSRDQEWVNSWLTRNKINFRLKEKKASPCVIQIPDAKGLLRESMRLVEDLQEMQDKLQDHKTLSAEAWVSSRKEYQDKKKRLIEIREVLTPSTVAEFALKFKKIKKKRMRLQEKKQALKGKEKEREKHREEELERIDQWQQRIWKIDEDKKKEKELKAAADQTLAEVHRKLSEAQKAVDLLQALTKLRQLRKEAAERKGIHIPESQDEAFEEHRMKLVTTLEEQLKIYKAERKTLEAMLEMEAEENREREMEEKKQKLKELERRKEQTIRQMLFGRVDLDEDGPGIPFPHYNQAEKSLEALINIRREWDIFLIPPGNGGSYIPECWVIPSEPSTEAWASVLKGRPPLL